ncbi:PREDICTED: general transcription factor IIH subunit 3-like [Drosophila arizonae]|uniref:General transcription factor IIH subunit 3 n=1 Tax=Drosophila arizonae TaxID=7263 RepID=A0ABM1NMC3_DROAR|nr:PREDICTED: general transcription factor IIH subunit 3-like [Drosophila arizonae]
MDAQQQRKHLRHGCRRSLRGSGLPEKNMLIIVVDYDANQSYVKRDLDLFTKVVCSITMFGNAHLLQSSENDLVIWSCSSYAVNVIYPEKLIDPTKDNDSQLEELAVVESLTRLRLFNLISQDITVMKRQTKAEEEQTVTALLPGTVAMVLSYLSRCRREVAKVAHIRGRILIVTGSKEPPIPLAAMQMNVFQVAARMGVVIDVCALELESSYMMRHAADITGGYYFSTSNFDTLSGVLLGLFLASPDVRQHLNYPIQPQADLRAMCFCHSKLVEMGFVCSCCLTVFCKYTPICGKCETIFKPPQELQMYIDNRAAQRRQRELLKLEMERQLQIT